MDHALLRRHLLILAFYIVLAAVLYSQVFFFGKSLLPALYYPQGATGTFGCTGRKPAPSHNVDLAAAAYEMMPTNRVVGDLYRSGTVPLWNPYQGGGIPLAAQYSTRVFFPFQILEDICPWWSWDYFMLARLVAAGFFTYLFLHLFGLPATMAFLGGLFYMFSGSMTWFINNDQFANVAMMLPAAMACLQNALIKPGNRSTVLLSAAICLVFLAGQPEMAFYVMLLLAAYCTFHVLTKKNPLKEKARLFGSFLSSLAMGIALSGVLILPFLENVFHSYSTHPFGIRAGAIDHANINYLAGIFFPLLTELPNFFDYFPHNGVWDNLGGYSGAAALFLAVAGFFTRKIRRSKYFVFFSLTGVFILLKNFDFPLVSWVGYLPLFNQAWSPRWAGPLWTFSFACAAGISLDVFAHRRCEKRAVWLTASLFAVGFGLFFYALYRFHSGYLSSFFSVVSDRLRGIAVPEHHLRDIQPFFAAYMGAMVCFIGALIYLLGYHRDRKQAVAGILMLSIAELWLCIPRGMDLSWMAMRVIPFFAVIPAVVLLVMRRKAFAYACIALAVFLSVIIDLSSPRGLPQRCDPFRKEPFVTYLQEQQGHFRIAGGKNLLMPNFAGVYRLNDVRFIAALSPEPYYALTNKYLLQTPHEAPTDRLWFTGIPDVYKENPGSIYEDFMSARNYYSFLGVRYVLSGPEVSLPLPLAYDHDIRIYENPGFWPRVFLTNRAVFAHTYQQAQAFIGGEPFYPGQAVAVEEDIPGRYLGDEAPGNARFSITGYEPNAVDIQGESDRGGILVLTDIFFPGWKAFVDGRPVPVLRINGLVRGILIDAGRHKVVFKYLPFSFQFGLTITLCAAAACCALWFINRRRNQPMEQ